MGNEKKNVNLKKNNSSVISEKDSSVNYVQEISRKNIFTSPPPTQNLTDSEKGEHFYDDLFSYIRDEHLAEAQEFRQKGYNKKTPGADPLLLDNLKNNIEKTQSQILLATSHINPDKKSRLSNTIHEIKKIAGKLSDQVMQQWIEDKISSPGYQRFAARHAGHSLARRLDASLIILNKVVDALSLLANAGDSAWIKNTVENDLINKLANFNPLNDSSPIKDALNQLKTTPSGDIVFTELMTKRIGALRAENSSSLTDVMGAVRREALKSHKKAGQLSGPAQDYFSRVADFLQRFHQSIQKELALPDDGENTPVFTGDELNNTKNHADKKTEFIKHKYNTVKTNLSTTYTSVAKHMKTALRAGKYGELTSTPTKEKRTAINDSILRSVLWQLQMTALKIQLVSNPILIKAKEYQKINGYLLPDSFSNIEDESVSSAKTESQHDEIFSQLQNLSYREDEEYKNRQKSETLNQLINHDLVKAKKISKHFKNAFAFKNHLKEKSFELMSQLLSIDSDIALRPTLWDKINRVLPECFEAIAASYESLKAVVDAMHEDQRDFTKIARLAETTLALANNATAKINDKAVSLTERSLDENSRGSRLAKHWANIARERGNSSALIPDVKKIHALLKENQLFEGTLSKGDPEGYLLATRVASELENAKNDDLTLPMSPEDYANLEKNFISFISNWGQKRISRGITRYVIELSFDQSLDVASFGTSNLVRLPFKIVKASIKIPYKVSKVNNYTMPGNDKPYKAIFSLLHKKLIQSGFNLLTTPIPGVMKLTTGIALKAGSAAYNLHTENKENHFSAVYERVVEGQKSKKIKTESLAWMAVAPLIDAPVTTGVKLTKHLQEKNRVLRKSIMTDSSPSPTQPELNILQKPNEEKNKTRNKRSTADAKIKGSNIDEYQSDAPNQQNSSVELGDKLKRIANDKNMHFSDLTQQEKEDTYVHAMNGVLKDIGEDENMPTIARANALEARMGLNNMTSVDINGEKIRNTLFLPDSPGSKQGVIINLNAPKYTYRHIKEGRHLPGTLQEEFSERSDKTEGKLDTVKNHLKHNLNLTNVDRYFRKIRSSRNEDGLNIYFNINDTSTANHSKLMNIYNIAKELAERTTEADKKHPGRNHNQKVVTRAESAIRTIDSPGEPISKVENSFYLKFSLGTGEEIFAGIARPFSSLAKYTQRVISYYSGHSYGQLLDKEKEAESIGGWIDITLGGITSLSPHGIVLNVIQSAASIGEDLARGDSPDPLNVAGLLLSVIPGGKIANKIGVVSKKGADVFSFTLKVSSETIDLIDLGNSIKTAFETGDPKHIYQALLNSGMKARDAKTYSDAIWTKVNKNSGANEVKNTKPISAEEFLPSERTKNNNEPEARDNKKTDISGKKSTANRRGKKTYTFKANNTELLGRRQGKKVEISYDNGATWIKGTKVHQLAMALQNAGGVPKLPNETGIVDMSSSDSGSTHSSKSHSPSSDEGFRSKESESDTTSNSQQIKTSSASDSGSANEYGSADSLHQNFNRHIETGGNPNAFLENIKATKPYDQARSFKFFNREIMGKVDNGEFNVSRDGGITWKKGGWLHEILWRIQTYYKRTASRLDAKIDSATAKDRNFSNICYNNAINISREAGVITSEQHKWLRNDIAKPVKNDSVMNSPSFRDAFNLDQAKPFSRVDSSNFKESGFIVMGEYRPDYHNGNVVYYEHLIFVHVTKEGVYLYQANSFDFSTKLDDPDVVAKIPAWDYMEKGPGRVPGKHTSIALRKNLLDQSSITRFNDYMAEDPNTRFVFIAASEIRKKHHASVKKVQPPSAKEPKES